MRSSVSSTVFALSCLAAVLNAQTSLGDGTNKLVELDAIKITGTRLPESSILRLSGLKIGDKVNDLTVNKACHSVTATGLVKKIDYAYDVYPDKPGVALTLTLEDEGPLFPARIKPQEDDDRIWPALLILDPLFSRQLPRTEKALAFYAANIERVLKSQGRENEYATGSVIGDANGVATEIVFEIRRYKELKKQK